MSTTVGPETLSAREHPVDPAARSRIWRWVAAVEVALAAAAVLFDLLIPSLVLFALAVVSLAVRREGPGSLGLRRWSTHLLVVKMLAFAAR